MARRSFKYTVIAAGGTPQPVFGTTLTAAVGPVADQRVTYGKPTPLVVADSSLFRVGDWVIVDIPPNEERIEVASVPDSTHITTQYPLAKSHASGKYVRLSDSVNAVYIQPLDGNADHLWIGTLATMVKASGLGVFVKLIKAAAGVQPTDWTDPVGFPANAFTTGDYWIDGTTNDSYLPSFTQI